jgi:hypothetical protein
LHKLAEAGEQYVLEARVLRAGERPHQGGQDESSGAREHGGMQSSSVGANSLSAYLSGTWRVHRRISFRSRSATAESAEVVLNGECCFESKESQRITASEFCSDECQRLQGRREGAHLHIFAWASFLFLLL